MGFLKFGSVKGLSYQHDFQGDIDRLYDQQRYAMEVRRERENKARYYGEMLQQEQATTPYNTQRLESYYDDLSGELADFVINNPNFETDINLQREFQGIAQRFQDNDIIREDMQVSQSYDLMRQAVAEGRMTEKGMAQQMEQYLDYANNGGDPYVFANMAEVNFNEMAIQIASALQPDTSVYDDDGQIKEITRYDDSKVSNLVRSYLSVDENNLAAENAYRNVAGSGLFIDKQDLLETTVKSMLNSKNVHAGWNPLYGLEEKAALQQQMKTADINPVFTSNFTVPLFSDKKKVSANVNHVALTSWNEIGGYFNPWLRTAGDTSAPKVKVRNIDYDPQNPEAAPEFTDLPNFNMGVTATWAGEAFRDNSNNSWIELDVTVALGKDQSDLRDKLSENGWTTKSFVDQGELPAAMQVVRGAKLTSNFMTGRIVVPAIVDNAHVLQYEQQTQTPTIGSKLIPTIPGQVGAFQSQQGYENINTLSKQFDPTGGGWKTMTDPQGNQIEYAETDEREYIIRNGVIESRLK